jgi:hypothetical protein
MTEKKTMLCSSNPVDLDKGNQDFKVLLYGTVTKSPSGYAIGNTCWDKILRLDIVPSRRCFDLVSIALSVNAADKFIKRDEYSVDGWARNIELTIVLGDPEPWKAVKDELETALNFLTSDIWTLNFRDGGKKGPLKEDQKDISKFIRTGGADSVCLFSGGLDSFIGASVLQDKGLNPVLVSRPSSSDKTTQEKLAAEFPNFIRFEMNDSPQRRGSKYYHMEQTSRARSFLFITMAALVCSSISRSRGGEITLYIPENGFIALNPPLHGRRIGASSTRTTHPYFLGLIQSIFKKADIPAIIDNPFELKTKGQMLSEAKSLDIVRNFADQTISCSHMVDSQDPETGITEKIHCGSCWPCFIRRAAFEKANFTDNTKYRDQDLKATLAEGKNIKHLQAIRYALHVYEKHKDRSLPIIGLRNISYEKEIRDQYMSMIKEGFDELLYLLLQHDVVGHD